jgi:hypothetical protein
VLQVFKVQQAQQDLLDPLVYKAQLVLLVPLEQQEQPVPILQFQVLLAQQVFKVQLGLKAQQVLVQPV